MRWCLCIAFVPLREVARVVVPVMAHGPCLAGHRFDATGLPLELVGDHLAAGSVLGDRLRQIPLERDAGRLAVGGMDIEFDDIHRKSVLRNDGLSGKKVERPFPSDGSHAPIDAFGLPKSFLLTFFFKEGLPSRCSRSTLPLPPGRGGCPRRRC